MGEKRTGVPCEELDHQAVDVFQKVPRHYGKALATWLPNSRQDCRGSVTA